MPNRGKVKPKNKKASRNKAPVAPKRRSWWNWLFFPAIALAVILILLIWQWQNIALWISNTINNTWELLGWGLALIVITALTMVSVLWRWKISPFIRHFNRWLGGIVFALAVWGILSFFNQGGSFGLDIIGYPDFYGILRILGLLIAGII